MFKSLKNIKRSFIVIAVLIAMLCNIPLEAASFYSYTYNDTKAVAAPDAALPVRNVMGIDFGAGQLKSPQDLFIYNNEIYIVDSGNNRIVITDINLTKSRIISEFNNNGKKDTFQEPQGICITKDEMYIADTKNARIVKLDMQGNLLMIIDSPKDESFPKDFLFKPSKVSVDLYNRVFVVSAGYNLGLMQFTPDGTYLKSIGAPDVTLTVFEQIRRKFSTKAQRERTGDVVPTEYSNISITDAGFIYVTSESTNIEVDALRKLNAKGADIINRIGDPSGDIIIGQGSASYKGASAIVDVTEVGGDGNIGILDRKRSRVFVYDDTCQLLFMFAGPGTYNGGLSVPSAMVYKDNKFYIADRGRNTISVFELTEYGKMFNAISKAKKDIDYKTEEALWKEIVSQNINCKLAMSGLGNAAYKRQDVKEAMHYYKLAEDRENYSKSFAFVRRQWIESNVIILLCIVAALIGLSILKSKFKKKYMVNAPKDSFFGKLEFSGYVTFHPLDGFWVLKREKRGSISLAFTWLIGAIVMMTVSNLFNGFIFNTNNLQTYSMFSNIAFILGAVALWTISQWSVTSLMDGEGRFSEIFISTCYSLRPYVILNIFATILSNVLLQTEGDFYTFLTILALLWVAMLLFTSVMQTHNYSLGKTILVIVIMLIVILLIVFIGMLTMALLQQVLAFVRDIISEVTLRV